MKRVLAALLVTLPLQAQDVPNQIELDFLRTPSSPAFVILGVSPTSITRPSTPRALATELLSASERGTVIPNNFAAEFAPYWIASRPALTYEQFRRPSLVQTLSFSLATSKADSSADSLAVQVAVGARALPIAGKVSKKYEAGEVELDALQLRRIPLIRAQTDAEDQLEEARARVVQLRAAGTDEDREAARQAVVSAQDAVDAALRLRQANADTIRQVVEEMGSPESERRGSFLEIATALAAAYPSPTFESGKLSRFGLWGTYTYRWETRVDLMVLGRVLLDLDGNGKNAGDVGGRLHYAYRNVGVSAEWIARTTFDVGDPTIVGSETQRQLTYTASSRVVGVVDYRAADDVYVTMSFGQDFARLGEERHPLVALFGMQLLAGRKPVVQRR